METLNPAHLETVIEFLNRGPYFQHLDMEITGMGIGYSTVVVNLQRFHLNPFGNVHGGVMSSAADVAAYWAVYCENPEETGMMSLDSKMDYLSTISSGRLIVRGRRIKVGKSICLAEAVAVDENDKWIAHGTSKILIREDLQSPKKAIQELTGKAVPPKFV